jgi:hypothetical protein
LAVICDSANANTFLHDRRERKRVVARNQTPHSANIRASRDDKHLQHPTLVRVIMMNNVFSLIASLLSSTACHANVCFRRESASTTLVLARRRTSPHHNTHTAQTHTHTQTDNPRPTLVLRRAPTCFSSPHATPHTHRTPSKTTTC